MDSRRWNVIQDIFHEAVTRERAARDEFLLERCQDDPVLFAEIQSLLACHEAPRPLWDDDPLEIGLKLLVLDEGLNIGQDFGNYTLKWIIGRGGMGDVYLACDNTLGRHVALKFLPVSLRSDPQWSLRFHEEARAASSIGHPNIAHIYELGNVDEHEYIAMEFIDGVTVRERLRQGRLDLSEAIEICEQVGRGIAAAHAVGVLHRDIKPENIMLTADGFVKVLDFGLAKTSTRARHGTERPHKDSTLTSRGIIMGTAAYMSPEQLRGEQTDSRTDIWSLGVTLYEMICGHHPFCGKTHEELKNAVLFQPPLPLATMNGSSSSPVPIEEILRRALQKNKENRYESIERFVEDLRRLKLKMNHPHSAWPSPDRMTASYSYPSTPAFHRTSRVAGDVTVHHAPRKERLLTLSVLLLTSLGFSGVLLGGNEIMQLLFRTMNVRSSAFPAFFYVFGTAENLLGGFAVGRVTTLIKIARPIQCLMAVVALILGYVMFFLTFHWLPSLSVFILYSLPYIGAALVGALIVFRPWLPAMKYFWRRSH